MGKVKKETAGETAHRLNLEKLTADMGRALGDTLKETAPHLGFALLMFEYGPADTGNLAYVSSARRDDMLNVLEEFKAMLIADTEKKGQEG